MTLDKKEYEEMLSGLTDEQKKLLKSGKHFYELTFSNLGGLVMPIIMEVKFADNTSEVIRIPAEIWRKQEDKVTKVFLFDKEAISFRVDPFLETGDTDLNNNSFPPALQPTRYELFKQKPTRENPMQRQKRLEKLQGN